MGAVQQGSSATNSFNPSSSFAATPAAEDITAAISALQSAVSELLSRHPAIDPTEKTRLAQHADIVATEAAAPKPDRGIMSTSIAAIGKIASALGEYGGTVLAAAAAVAKLFGFGT